LFISGMIGSEMVSLQFQQSLWLADQQLKDQKMWKEFNLLL
jgi:hypothetical protein